MSNHHHNFAEWPLAERRLIRKVELVVSAAPETRAAKSGSVVYDSADRPRRVVPLALGLSIAILLFVQGMSTMFHRLDPAGPDLRNITLVESAMAKTSH